MNYLRMLSRNRALMKMVELSGSADVLVRERQTCDAIAKLKHVFLLGKADGLVTPAVKKNVQVAVAMDFCTHVSEFLSMMNGNKRKILTGMCIVDSFLGEGEPIVENVTFPGIVQKLRTSGGMDCEAQLTILFHCALSYLIGEHDIAKKVEDIELD
jgi:hypothetical protein